MWRRTLYSSVFLNLCVAVLSLSFLLAIFQFYILALCGLASTLSVVVIVELFLRYVGAHSKNEAIDP